MKLDLKFVDIMALVFAFIITGIAVTHNTQRNDAEAARQYKIGLSDGWNAYGIDSWAVRQFHEEVKLLPAGKDEDPATVEAVWQSCVDEAKLTEAAWAKLTPQQKYDYKVDPFWKRNAGPPRYISKGQHEAFTRALKGVPK